MKTLNNLKQAFRLLFKIFSPKWVLIRVMISYESRRARPLAYAEINPSVLPNTCCIWYAYAFIKKGEITPPDKSRRETYNFLYDLALRKNLEPDRTYEDLQITMEYFTFYGI